MNSCGETVFGWILVGIGLWIYSMIRGGKNG